MNGSTSKNIAPYIVSGIAAVFLIVIAYAMFFVPKMNESKALVSSAATAHASNVALTAKADKLEAIAKNLTPLKTQVDQFKKAFPSGAEQQNMIDAINAAASSTGVTLTTLNPNVPEPAKDEEKAPAASAAQATQVGTELPGPAPVAAAAATQSAPGSNSQLGTVNLKIDGKGDLAAVQAFLVKIENLERPITAHELQIEKQENGYHVMISGTTFLAAPLVEPQGK
ncbi:hypothetical protein Achl_4164 (plasmid) [Pseudarthrobacter chlorophenolicus A6]|uniref:Uncharacterized protein n=1 Tax=Pseudarthrobacter chlorophenolicus (strain ATCC 700700 / DSM 12829 / CIP 107037 / JCM 12360 / KCTC 9906 / NCIMB 13794 / A6) TaxID=452863 RepID=B8HI68_PSECP|nr:type 4a pilus biogenesis protein PilO [Pseudarthrobacter chlorophenolicus]ACL42115.1 hypothetical protein Achl_4164 [Pseudarthrobacter chlorophenolicus A6]SDQ13627.1 Pilus assembly protein, PilO [Pseudarthrobacter chlorophenolicus]